jgi:hypothetical protein
MEDIRKLYKGTITECGFDYIEACMECAVQSAIVDHMKASSKVLRDMKMEVSA